MKKIVVHYCGWGEDWPLGQLADDGRTLLFEYSPQALQEGLELSPLYLPLKAQAFGGFPVFQHRLPGLVADSLPDGWGLLLMDRLFRRQGLPPPGPLDRLSVIGDRAMGALRFLPAEDLPGPPPDWNLLALAQESERVLADQADVALRELVLAGGSPQGARPKALVRYQPDSGRVSTQPDGAGSPWLVKFQAQGEHKEACAIESLYARLARECGLDMPDHALFDLSPSLAAFGVARFDRVDGHRVPIHSLAGLLHVDFHAPGSTDYTTLLRATRHLTRDRREVLKAYARAVFNVLFHNRDDHPKNFAWRLDQDRRWRLAPAYDLTFSNGPGGQHHMDVCGEGSNIRRAHLLRLATEADVPAASAKAIIDPMLDVAACLPRVAADYPIRRATVRTISAAVARCRQQLMS